MRLPSFEQIARDSARTLNRFPFVLFAAAAGTAAALLLADSEAGTEPAWAFRVLLAAILGIPFLTALALFTAKRGWSTSRSLFLQGFGVLLLGAYGFSLPANITLAPEIHVIRFVMLAGALHLFVAIAPWLGRGQVNGFWHFNKTLLLRMITAGLFTLVLFAGLAIALAAVENLFDVTVPGKRYFQLWILLVGMLTTWFFLAGIPEDLDALDTMTEYPKGLKIFTQYVLFPLVLIYLVILTAYTGKIILTWTWPHGWTARLILGFAAAGMLALLLLHPIREDSGNRWIRLASRWFYIFLAPLVLVYFLAVLRRLSDYGMTEGRYIAVVAGAWLAVMVLYFLFSRGKSIKAIPITLCVITLLITVGPWGAFAISENSQVNRLETLLKTHGILVNGKAHKSADPVPFEAAREISAALEYLHDVHGYGEIQSWFSGTLREDSLGARTEWRDASSIAADIGVEYVAVRLSQSDDQLSFEASEEDAMIVTGYDRMFPERYFFLESPTRTVISGTASYHLNPSLDTLTFVRSQPGQVIDSIDIPLTPVIDSLVRRYHDRSAENIPPEFMAVGDSVSATGSKSTSRC